MRLVVVSVILQMAAVVWSLALARRRKEWQWALIGALAALSGASAIWMARDGGALPLAYPLGSAALLAALWIVRPGTKVAALRESEDRYRDLVEHSQDLICTHDLEGRLLSVNSCASQILGYTTGELARMNLADVLAPEARGKMPRYVARIREHGRADGFMIVQTKTGEKRVWAYKNTLRTEGVAAPVVRGMAHDVTEQKKAEDKLRASEARYRNLVASLPGTVYTLRVDAAGRRSMPFVSQRIGPFSGLPAAAVMEDAERAFSLIPATWRTLVEESIAESGKHLTAWLQEFPIRTVAGEEKWIRGHSLPRREPDGSTVWTGVFVDITDQKRAREKLRESERRYEQLVENIHDAIIVDDIAGRLTFANRRFREWFGLGDRDPGAIILEDYVAPEWRSLLRDRHDRRVRGESVPDHFEYEGSRPDGTRMWIEVLVTPVLDGGIITGTQSAMRDITERKRMEAQALQAQKLESVGLLAGGIAHDFNNLLTVINGYSQRVLSRMDARDPLRGPVGEILTAGERAAELTSQLLAFSRKQPSDQKALDLNGLIRQDESLIRRLTGEDVEIHIQLGEDAGWIQADASQLRQVLLNLVVNAREAMPRGGRLTIETARVEISVADAARNPGAKPGRFARLDVRDSGSGMDEVTRQHLFDPFYTTKQTGTGLGLATVHGVVSQHGGWICVDSAPDRGTTFQIYLPGVERAGGVAKASTGVRTPGAGGTETILAVEDRPELLRLVAEFLTSSGYQVLQAACGGDAIEVCRSYGGRIHLLLTDVVMPGMSGRDLAERLRAARPDLRVLFMSGYGENVIARHGILDSGVSCLAKPFDQKTLLAKVRSMLD